MRISSFSIGSGDVLMLDNMLAADVRTSSFSGPREVVVAMAPPHAASA